MRTMISMIAILAVSSVAFGAATNVRPVTIEPTTDLMSLQQALDSVTVSGPGFDVIADQKPYALFTNGATGGSVAAFVIELSGNAANNSFGIYSAADPSKKAEIFTGADGQGDIAMVSFMANGDIMVNLVVVASGFSKDFGFYINTGQATYYTEDDLNGGSAHALVFQGDGQSDLQIPGMQSGPMGENEFIIAFEDGTDGYRDFNDMVVMVESIVPVPAPAAALLGVMGLAAVGFVKRRFR